jgi:hypothetical protein
MNRLDRSGLAALHYAVKNNATEIVTLLLLTEGIDVNVQDRKDLCTPFHYACRNSHPEIGMLSVSISSPVVCCCLDVVFDVCIWSVLFPPEVRLIY